MKNKLRSIIFSLYVIIVSPLCGIIFLPTLVSRRASLWAAKRWAWAVVLGAKYIMGITHNINGKEYIPQGPAVVASKHQSAWETIVFFIMLPKASFVIKKSLLYLPIIGLYMWRLRLIYLDRSKGVSSIKKLITQCKARLEEGHQVVIFPEGTRSNYGDKPNYKPGIFAIYKKLNSEIVPVALDSGLYWPRNSYFGKTPGSINVRFNKPIQPGLENIKFMENLYNIIEYN